jgi:hypothetical protein
MNERPHFIPRCQVRHCKKLAAERLQVDRHGWAGPAYAEVCRGHRHIYRAQAERVGATVTVIASWIEESSAA